MQLSGGLTRRELSIVAVWIAVLAASGRGLGFSGQRNLSHRAGDALRTYTASNSLIAMLNQ